MGAFSKQGDKWLVGQEASQGPGKQVGESEM